MGEKGIIRDCWDGLASLATASIVSLITREHHADNLSWNIGRAINWFSEEKIDLDRFTDQAGFLLAPILAIPFAIAYRNHLSKPINGCIAFWFGDKSYSPEEQSFGSRYEVDTGRERVDKRRNATYTGRDLGRHRRYEVLGSGETGVRNKWGSDDS
tara:strand:- start:756 stop:1223 length:468 start_codon:yes stop_codon:yes gene_type:complete